MDDIDQFLMNVRAALRFALTDKSKLNLSWSRITSAAIASATEKDWDEALRILNSNLERFSDDCEKFTYAILYGLPYDDETRDKFVWKLNELLRKINWEREN